MHFDLKKWKGADLVFLNLSTTCTSDVVDELFKLCFATASYSSPAFGKFGLLPNVMSLIFLVFARY